MSVAEVPISKTKILLPKRRAELLSRRRLLDILYERLDRRLLIVSAPAGYGKTSLLIDLAQQSELTFCWLALDPLDRDPQRFLTYFIAALTERFPQFGARSRSALNRMTGFQEGLEPLVVTLVNEIHDEIAEHFALVLDDFHILEEAYPIQSFLSRFLQLMGENCHIILSSRTLPELPDIPLLVARDEVGGLDFSDLSFRAGEIQALLAQNKHVELSDAEARKLEEATEGWITGIQFANLDLLRQGRGAFGSAPSMGVSVFDFLGNQVLGEQPDELRIFMLRSSLLEEFDAALCEAVLAPLYEKPPDWIRLLETIRQKNLFALPVGSNGQWLRYHHLFRDYLQKTYRDQHPDEITPTLRRLAKAHEDRGEWEAAYHVCRQLADQEALVSLIERGGDSMYQNAMLTLESWLNELPPDVVGQRPILLSLRGAVAHLRGQASQAVQDLDAAIAQLKRSRDAKALGTAFIRRCHAYRFLGRYTEAIADAASALKLSEDKPGLEGIFADALRARGLSLFRQGHTRQALEDLEKSLKIQVRNSDPVTVPHLLMETAMARAILGEYGQAKSSYEKALGIWRQAGNLFSESTLLNNYGFLHYQLGEYEEAAQTFEEGLLCARQCGHKRMEALISISMGDLYSEIEDFEIAAQNYRTARTLADALGDRFVSNYLQIAEANLELLKREPARARAILKGSAAGIRASDSLFEYGQFLLARGRLFLEEGNPGQAAAQFREAKDCFTQDGREMESIWAGIWLATAYGQNKRTAEAIQELGAALQPQRQVSHAAAVAARQAGKWLEALRYDQEARLLLRGLFERADRLDDQLPGIRRQLRRMARTIEIPAPSLKIRALGRGQVWVNGNLVSSREWQTQAVRELFFYFLAMNKPVTKEQVGSVLWPETTEPSRLRLRFKNEIYRLRRAVGQNTILYEDEYYQLNPAVDHEYDVEAFEAYLGRAKGAALPAEQIRLYQKAVDLVGGSYLEDIGAVWVIPERERLHQAALSASLTLADLYFQEGHSSRALEVCQLILERESTVEAAYRLKMNIYERLGDRAGLIRTYRDCEHSLRDVFGTAPSEETRSLFQKLSA